MEKSIQLQKPTYFVGEPSRTMPQAGTDTSLTASRGTVLAQINESLISSSVSVTGDTHVLYLRKLAAVLLSDM